LPTSVAELDRGDPAARAEERVRRQERRHAYARIVAGLALGLLAITAPAVAEPLTGDPGATVGAVVLAGLLAGCAAVVWPWTWTGEERAHHELAAVWSEARGGAGEDVPWDRYAAWARADGERVELVLLRRVGSSPEPSPYREDEVRRIEADDVGDAAAAMEELRERAAALEARAREEHLEALSTAERREHEEALARVEEAVAVEQREAEAQMRHELAAQEAAERRAQAAAVARALRRK
jgi:hypothetical protein